MYFCGLFQTDLNEVHLLRNSQENVGTIIWLSFCYDVAIIWIKVELYM